ncbi:nitrate reductase molybdenum cofactor assembly chaperone [Kitasatospora sp. NPDC058063]|uniref:nitrate reductase molybdenum cofactor assembly chaperone n=1 Tax=unclassified Kitasatospora TaxID=2633591 RepID=UPI0036DEF813
MTGRGLRITRRGGPNSRGAHRRAVVRQAAALCLVHPDAELYERLPLLREALALPGVFAGTLPGADGLLRFLDHAERIGPAALAEHYVEVFDFTERHSLHLSWWTDGDTRRRGAALLRFRDTYRHHGLDQLDGELPDFLPVVLEFAAATHTDDLLRDHRPGLELLRLALLEAGTPYAGPLEAVCATLPGPSPADRAQALALARSGPPREEVGAGSGLPPHGQPPADGPLAPYGHLHQLPVITGDR